MAITRTGNYVEGDDNGGETWKRQGDAIQYLEDAVKKLEGELK